MNNQLEAIVSYVSEYFRSIQIPQLPDICLPPLRECIEFPPVSKEAVQEQKKKSDFMRGSAFMTIPITRIRISMQ